MAITDYTAYAPATEAFNARDQLIFDRLEMLEPLGLTPRVGETP